MHTPTPKLRDVLLLNGSQIDMCDHYASLVHKLHLLPEQLTVAISLTLKVILLIDHHHHVSCMFIEVL